MTLVLPCFYSQCDCLVRTFCHESLSKVSEVQNTLRGRSDALIALPFSALYLIYDTQYNNPAPINPCLLLSLTPLATVPYSLPLSPPPTNPLMHPPDLLPQLHHRRNPRHHLLFRNQMIDPLQQSQQALHAPTPLIQHLVRIPHLGETDDPSRAVDLRVHRLRRHQLADVRLRFLLVEIEQLGEPAHLDARVVFGDDADVVFDDAFAEVLPALVGFGVGGVGGGGGGGRVEDVGGAEVGAEFLGDDGPAHEFGDGEEFEELGFRGDEAVAGVGVDAVQEVGLFVVVGGEDDVVDDSLEDLGGWFVRGYVADRDAGHLLRVVARGFLLLTRCLGPAGSVCTPLGTCHRASRG